MRLSFPSSGTRRLRFAALPAATLLLLSAFAVAGAHPAGASLPCIPGTPHCTIKPPPTCLHISTPLPSTVAQPVTLHGGATVQTTATATTQLSAHGDFCEHMVLLTYHAAAPAKLSVNPHDVHLSVSVELHDRTTTTQTTPIAVTVHPGGTADAHDQRITVADSFTPTDLVLITAG